MTAKSTKYNQAVLPDEQRVSDNRGSDGRRIKQLDGVRTLAILLVIGLHDFKFRYGWAGVDLFFVLSGFLITGILRRDRTEPAYWSAFYIRRATRIVPPLAICFLATAVFARIPWHRLWYYYVFFAANVGEALYRGQSKNLGVLWSLAVEEHFYLIWPFAVRFMSRRKLIVLLLIVICGEPIARAIATPLVSSSWPIFLLTPFRLDGLAAGSLIALVVETEQAAIVMSRWSGRVLIGSLCLMLAGSTSANFQRMANSVLFNSLGYTLIVLISSALVVNVVYHRQSWLGNALSCAPAVFIGRISYGMYLFNPLVIDQSRTIARTVFGLRHNLLLAPLNLFITIGISWMSYSLVEQPIIKWGHRLAKGVAETARSKSEIAAVAGVNE